MSPPTTHRRRRGTDPIASVPIAPSDRAVVTARTAVAVTFVAWIAFLAVTLSHQFGSGDDRLPLAETLVYVAVISLLAGSNIAYLTARLGSFARARAHRRADRATIDARVFAHAPSLTVLVPSYQEEARVVRLTLLSAALQEYPDLRVVLLIDDPPRPADDHAEQLLRAARALPGEIEALLAAPGARFAAAHADFCARAASAQHATAAEIHALADHYDEAITWLDALIEDFVSTDHAEQFVRDHVVGRLAADLSTTAAALRSAAGDPSTHLSTTRVGELYARLAAIFRARLTSFERKRYVSLSHAPNKAMNLNSYLGLMGGRYREQATPRGPALIAASDADDAGTDLDIPNPDYVLTLDADSVVLPEYCLRLVDLLEQDDNARVAVAQTPYSAYPGAPTQIERIAGATTDVQHIIHQGMTHYHATFWVGANAVLRKQALDDIRETEHAGDWPIHRYVKDRTPVEDTESSIDLIVRDWELVNYPERLSYSATPPDFGALCIQRQRWASGGLLLAPKLLTYMRARRARGQTNRFAELALRASYMTSIALPLLLVCQFAGPQLSPLVLVIGAPYFASMALDLRACGYQTPDVLRVYALNLLLLPVQLVGWASSIARGLTGSKSQFRRTPKIRRRTVPAPLFVVFPYALIALSLLTLRADCRHDQWVNAFVAAANALLGLYAIVAFIGLRTSLGDLWASVGSWTQRPLPAPRWRPRRTPRPQPVPATTARADGQDVLNGAGGAAPPAHADDAPRDRPSGLTTAPAAPALPAAISPAAAARPTHP